MIRPCDHCNNGHTFVFVSQSIELTNLYHPECQNLIQQSMRKTYRYTKWDYRKRLKVIGHVATNECLS